MRMACDVKELKGMYAQQNITKYNINSNINVAYKINEFDYSVSIPYEKYHPTLLFCLLNASQLR